MVTMPADQTPHHHLDKEKLKQKFELSNFDINPVIRGVQLTLVGGKYWAAREERGVG